ncbi:MAG: hypothetical protein V4501_02045 [Pseudomonadota bacterium]
MDKEKMVKDAISLAKKHGVIFSDTTPSFRPKKDNRKEIVYIQINFSGGQISKDFRFSELDQFDEIKLANFFIELVNEKDNQKLKKIE